MRVCRFRGPSSHLTVVLISLALLASWSSDAAARRPLGPPDAGRIAEIAAMLPEKPGGVGPTIDDRAAWKAVAALADAKKLVRTAERLAKQPIAEVPDELYLEFSRSGNRSHYQRAAGALHRRVCTLVLAECIEDRGRFLPAIEEAIRAVCAMKTWVLPAHDRGLANFKGTRIDIDLWTAYVSWTLATADHWLGDKLSGDVRKLIRGELERRTFKPFENGIRTGKPRLWWITGTNNWNAVCLAGTAGAALATIDSRERRAWFVAAAERSIKCFLSGFTPDGYCSEGIGYWNYGFGNYTNLAETLFQATGGKIDWFADPKIKPVALFGWRMQIVGDVYPAFADCGVRAKPDLRLMAFLSRRLKLGLADVERRGLLLAPGIGNNLFEFGLFGFANSASKTPPVENGLRKPSLRDWFADAGIFIGRPAGDRPGAMGVALKGGHNAEHHNHNDVGSFVIALAGEAPLLDPGGENYTARTFSSHRYESGVLNSWGHPVPRVAGKLQRTGRSAAAKVVKTDFADAADTLVLDLQAAYDVKPLEKLQRRFVYSRAGRCRLIVTDEVAFDSPQQFGTALITYSKWRRMPDGGLVVGEGPAAVRVEVSATGGRLKFQEEEIKEDCHGHHPRRLGFDFDAPVRAATITMTIHPAGE